MKWLSWKTLQPNTGPFFWNKEYQDIQCLHSNSIPHRDVKPVNLSYLWKAQCCSETQGFCRGDYGLQLLSSPPPTLHCVAPWKYDKACHHGYSNVIMFVSILTQPWPHPLSRWKIQVEQSKFPYSKGSEKSKEVKMFIWNMLEMFLKNDHCRVYELRDHASDNSFLD